MLRDNVILVVFKFREGFDNIMQNSNTHQSQPHEHRSQSLPPIGNDSQALVRYDPNKLSVLIKGPNDRIIYNPRYVAPYSYSYPTLKI